MRGTAVLRQQKYDGHRSLSRREIQKPANGSAAGNTGNAVCFVENSCTVSLFNNRSTAMTRAANFTWMCFTALKCLSLNPFTLEHFLKQFRFNFSAVFKPQTLTTKKTYQPWKVWSFTKIPVMRYYFRTNRSFMQLPACSSYCTLKHFGSETVKNGSLQGNCHDAPAKTRWSKQLATTAAFNFSEAS